jgi:methylated-DNA-[protein]-cysteine S-methyltransferase
VTSATYYHLFDIAIGVCGIAWNERGIVRLQLPANDARKTEARLTARLGNAAKAQGELPPPIRAAVAELLRYFSGEKPDFTAIATDLRDVDPLRGAIYDELRKIGWGKTVTYGELGKRIGVSDAREIGQAMGSNPVPVIIPCHRVLAAGNKIGGFSAPGGAATKEKLLALEGVRIGEPVLPGLFG